MAKPSFKNPGRVFAVWAAALAATLALGIVFNGMLQSHVNDIKRHDPRAFLQTAQRLMDENDVLGAFARLEDARRIAPESPEPDRLQGLFHFRLKHWEKAFGAFQRSIAKGDRKADVRLKALSALLQLGRREEAAAFGRKCLDDGYTYRTFPRYIADAYRGLGKHAEAIPYYEQALEGYPSDLYLMEHLAQACRTTGQTDRAETIEARMAEIQMSLDGLVE